MQQVQSDLLSKAGKTDDVSPVESTSNSPIHQPVCSISTLIIILHGGSLLDVGPDQSNSKSLDITTFRSTMDTIIGQHYPHLTGRLAIRYVACPPICLDSLLVLSSLSPYSVQSSPTLLSEATSRAFDSLPFSALPLFAVSSFDYHENVINVIGQCNKVYSEFVKSDEGKNFSGKVCLIGDSVGSILGFDALCNNSNQANIYDSELSIQNGPESLRSMPMTNPVISITDPVNSATEPEIGPETSQPKRGKSTKPQVYCKSLSHPGDSSLSSQPDTLNRLYISSIVRRRSSGSSDFASAKFDFEVSDYFMFGSSIGIVLTYRKMLSLDDKSCKLKQAPTINLTNCCSIVVTLMKPACTNLYNLFHQNDPSALRIEPLLSARFSYITPVNVPRYQKFPLGDGQPIHLRNDTRCFVSQI